MSNVTQLEEAIKNVFDAADQLARATGCVQRVQPGKFTGTLRRRRSWACSNQER